MELEKNIPGIDSTVLGLPVPYFSINYKASEDFLDSSKSFTKFEHIEAGFLGAPL